MVALKDDRKKNNDQLVFLLWLKKINIPKSSFSLLDNVDNVARDVRIEM